MVNLTNSKFQVSYIWNFIRFHVFTQTQLSNWWILILNWKEKKKFWISAWLAWRKPYLFCISEIFMRYSRVWWSTWICSSLKKWHQWFISDSRFSLKVKSCLNYLKSCPSADWRIFIRSLQSSSAISVFKTTLTISKKQIKTKSSNESSDVLDLKTPTLQALHSSLLCVLFSKNSRSLFWISWHLPWSNSAISTSLPQYSTYSSPFPSKSNAVSAS